MTEWSPARKKAFIVSVLRSGTQRYPPKYLTLNEAKTEKKINKKSGRLAQHFQCAECLGDFPAKDIQCDHINPVVDPKQGFVSWDVYIERLYCEKENFQILCKPCHLIKSQQEKKDRKK
ncbi:MAG: HNH endonuclease signature motif containing protein [Candidatus Magasanikiibacteriota bacterium]